MSSILPPTKVFGVKSSVASEAITPLRLHLPLDARIHSLFVFADSHYASTLTIPRILRSSCPAATSPIDEQPFTRCESVQGSATRSEILNLASLFHTNPGTNCTAWLLGSAVLLESTGYAGYIILVYVHKRGQAHQISLPVAIGRTSCHAALGMILGSPFAEHNKRWLPIEGSVREMASGHRY